MDFRDNITVTPRTSLDFNALQHEADSSRFDLISAVQHGLDEIPTPIAVGVATITGIAARLPGQIGVVGKIGAAVIGTAAAADSAVRAFGISSPGDNNSAYIKDTFTLSALTAGIILGPRLFSTETTAGTAFTRDLARQKEILAGAGFEGGIGQSTQGVRKVIQDAEIAQFEAAKQIEIRAGIEAMVKNGHKPEFLMLSKDGKVLIDREAIETAADIAAFKKP